MERYIINYTSSLIARWRYDGKLSGRKLRENRRSSFYQSIASRSSLPVFNRFDKRKFCCIPRHTSFLPKILFIYYSHCKQSSLKYSYITHNHDVCLGLCLGGLISSLVMSMMISGGLMVCPAEIFRPPVAILDITSEEIRPYQPKSLPSFIS